MSTGDSAEDIRRRMAELRRDLSSDVHEVSRGARIMTDWRFYVRRFPWAVVGAAAVAGYMLIPQKKQVNMISPNPDDLAKMFKKEQLKIQTPADKKSKETPGLMKSMLLMGLTWAAKAGMNYMGERVRTVAADKAHERATSNAAPSSDARRPQQQSWPK